MRRALLFLSLLACTKSAHEPTASPPAPAVSLSHVPVPVPVPVPDPKPTASVAPPSSPPPASSGTGASGTGSSASGTDEPPPHVKLATIGMHVGGGPYDEPTKEPMKRSVEPRFLDLARCWKLVTKPAPTDFGVDLVIEASGGRAKVSNPRTSVTSEGFVPCVVAFFESVEFERPRNGKTVVSYSVRFTP
jgi:hypothetical protein